MILGTVGAGCAVSPTAVPARADSVTAAPAGFAGADQTVALGSPVHFAATPAANLPYRFWT
ncbi:MAG TPA: hypothetical protein VNH84_06945, partial [Candidatus Saccharimonadales bacterium]|nr:hypothetical protein [Candidatus Saccharimonadales bacterium]